MQRFRALAPFHGLDWPFLVLWVNLRSHTTYADGLRSGIFVLVGDLWDESAQTWNINGVHIVRQQDFWYVMGMTLWIALPWICTRRVKIDIELVSSGYFHFTSVVQYLHRDQQPSNKVAVLRFERGMQQGLLGRISRSAVKEYHAFGIIS